MKTVKSFRNKCHHCFWVLELLHSQVDHLSWENPKEILHRDWYNEMSVLSAEDNDDYDITITGWENSYIYLQWRSGNIQWGSFVWWVKSPIYAKQVWCYDPVAALSCTAYNSFLTKNLRVPDHPLPFLHHPLTSGLTDQLILTILLHSNKHWKENHQVKSIIFSLALSFKLKSLMFRLISGERGT